MRAARSAETTRIRVDPGKLELPVHLHVENSRDLGQVFQATPKRIKEALERHPQLAGKVKVTIGYDGDIYGRAVRTAHVLFGWRFDRVDLAEKAPHLRWVHAHGAGINHLCAASLATLHVTMTSRSCSSSLGMRAGALMS